MPSSLSYEVVEGWGRPPAGISYLDVAGVSVDSKDRVYVVTRMDARVIVYERDGTFVGTFGEGMLTERTHGITVGPDDCVYTVDDGDHTVRKFTPDGRLLMTIGTPGVASDTGSSRDGRSLYERMLAIRCGGPPFNQPTALAVAPSGELYVSDGYGNARVHRFSAEGALIQSWGEPGIGPGQFYLPHGIWVVPDGRVFVADRENDRIQIFSPTGEFLDQWTHVQHPADVAVDAQGLVYVPELIWRVGQHSFVHGPIKEEKPSRMSVFDLEGKLLARWGGADSSVPGNFWATHTVAVDSHGDIYVGEVTYTSLFGSSGKPSRLPDGFRNLQKFVRK